MILLTKLLLAHMMGDFILQPASWIKAKEEKKLGAWQLYVHGLVHGVLIMLLVWDGSFLKWAVLLALVHVIIDALKVSLQKPETQRIYFFADQALHVLSVCLIYYWSQAGVIDWPVWKDEYWLLITLIVMNTLPGAIAIKAIIAKWSPQLDSPDKESLQEAGKYIGILERLFVFTFVVTGNWEAIGFLIAAKSVFRFGDLTNAKDRKLTEYILTGTLISFGMAMLSGIVYLRLTSL